MTTATGYELPTLADALELAEAGWEVLPLRGKIPTTAHGVKDASADPAQVRRWWAGGARHNVGARVPSALLVLDIDPQNGGTLEALAEAAGGFLPPTLTVVSGRGIGGRHLYYRHPGGEVSSRRLPPGIDVKTDRGYCVVPPSLHPATGRPYTWEGEAVAQLPAQLIALLRPEVRQTPQRSGTGSMPRTPLALRAAHLARHVESATEGGRNARLFWAACQAIRDGHPPETFDLLEGAAMVAGLSQTEAARTIASAHRSVRGGA